MTLLNLKKCNKKTGEFGFTLVEIQIAILILLLIVAVLMGGLQLSAKTNNAAEKLAERSADMRIVSRLLQQQISNIIPLKALENGKSKLIFDGEQDSIYYMGYLSEKVVKGGPWFIHLYQKNKQLLLDYKTFDNTKSMQRNNADDFEQVVVLEGFDELIIDYQSDNDIWTSHWGDDHNMPKLVRIKLSQDNIPWPIITIPLYSYAATDTPFHVLQVQ
jgi:general secretion pathway protein J